ncbi:SCAR2 protein [Nymphaea thermarum]|nr:SCAR2 protein [Nymphaea thermarum]
MPLTRYVIRNEYSLADPEVYRCVEKDDPEALLEGIAMAGLIGVLRQLGDLAEFAAELFHDLHEEVMATSARGHGLMIRVQQLEAELPSIEKAFLSRTNHLEFAYGAGSDWHSSERIEQNLVTRGDLPRFVMDSYEECRAPPRLFLLDKFDIAGAGACLKRYSDPSFFKMELASSGALKADEVQIGKRARRVKRKAFRQRNGDTLEALLDSSTDDASLAPDVKSAKTEKIPFHIVKLKMRQMNGYACSNKKLGGTYMEQILEATVDNNDNILAVNHFSLLVNTLDDVSSALELHGKNKEDSLNFLQQNGNVQVPSTKRLKDMLALPSNESVCDLGGSAPEKSVETVDHSKKQAVTVNDGIQEDVVVDSERKTVMTAREERSDDFVGDLETYLDALATIESEIETDSECQIKHENELFTLNHLDVDSDRNGDQLCQLSENCNSHVDNSPASYDSNCSFVKGEREISYADSLHGLTDRKPPQVAKVLPIDDSLETMNISSDSQNSLELKDLLLGNLCDEPHPASAENTPTSSTDDALVRSSASDGSSTIEDMNDITLTEDSEKCVEAPISSTAVDAPFESAASCHTSEDAACGSAEHASASKLSSMNEKSSPDEGQILVAVMTPECNEQHKFVETPISDVTGDVHVEGASSCKMSGEEASASLMVHAVSTFASPHEEPIKGKAQKPAPVMFPESDEECKPEKSIIYDVQFEGASSCQMSGEVSSSHDKPTSDEVYMPASVMLPGSNTQDKFVESQVSDILDSMPSEGGSGLILEQPSCASSMPNGTLLLPCLHDGSGLEELQTSFPQEGGRISNPDTSSALEPSTAFASNEPVDNSDDQLALPDAPSQSTVAELNVEASMQCPDEAISCDSFISESGDPFPLVGKKEPEQCESGILATEDVSVDLSKLQHGEMDKSKQNIAPRGNLELMRTITAIEDEKCMIIGESAETTAASIISPHNIVINESAEADVTSHDVHDVHDVLSENFETLNTPSVKMISTTQVMDEHKSYLVSKVPDSEGFTSKSVKIEREEFSGKLHNETENLEIPTITDAIFEDSQPEPLTNVIEESSHCVDIEPVHVVTETVEPNCETKDKHVQDEMCLASRYVALNGSLQREMPADSMLPNVAGTVEASSQSGISSASFVEGDNASTVDDSMEILSNNTNLEACPASEAIAGQHSNVLAELSIISESGLSNGSASHEFPHGTTIRPSVVAPLGFPATMNLDSSLQIHGDGLDKGHSDYAKISCGDVTCSEEIAPYQLEVDTCTSPVRALDKSYAESSELDSAGILVSSGCDNLELPCALNLGPEQHYLPSVSAQVESEGNMPVAPLLENCRDANVQSSSAASVEEVELGSDQCKLHDEQISTVPEGPANSADDSHEERFAYVQPCLQQKAAMKGMGVDQPKLQVEQMSVTSDTSDNFRGELQEECSACMEPSYQHDAPRKETDLDESKLYAEQISVVSDASCSFTGVSQEECLANHQKVEVKEVNADQHKHHNEGVTMVSEVLKVGLETEEAHSASVELQKVDIQEQSIRDDHHPSDYTEVYSRNLVHLEQGGISEALELSSSTPSQDRMRFIESEETVSFNYQLPENKRNETVPQPVLSLAQVDEVVTTTSAHMDDQSSTLELGRAENLEESGHHVSHGFLKDDAGLPNNVSVEGIPSTAPDPGLPKLGKPLLPAKDEHSSVPGVLFPPGALVRSSSALVFGSAEVISQTDQVENHKRELVHNGHQTNAGHNISTSLVFPHLGIGTETDGMPPLPLPPVEWIMGRPRQSFFPLPGEASQQPIFIPSYPTAEAGQSNGVLPWKHRSLYRRPKDPLIEAVASHDKSTLRKVTERDRTEVKPKADEREVLLEQIRAKSFNLKPIAATKPAIQGPKTNIKVAAILEKANAIRQACAGTGSDDDDDEVDKWSDT